MSKDLLTIPTDQGDIEAVAGGEHFLEKTSFLPPFIPDLDLLIHLFPSINWASVPTFKIRLHLESESEQ